MNDEISELKRQLSLLSSRLNRLDPESSSGEGAAEEAPPCRRGTGMCSPDDLFDTFLKT